MFAGGTLILRGLAALQASRDEGARSLPRSTWLLAGSALLLVGAVGYYVFIALDPFQVTPAVP
ncbi:hypothetical protein KIH74_08895 [Kineosporia sp. J2-2]|uniref:Uncharacterized protein n=1 Tax=Kineosporia corallincola TaxID=2835133 RepID=A0ABS5TD82_9ACTN|nr:hypothetical protein [Kineosporia corallincola]MBT0769042.1 hypothetical protein [Kineosporia corallincola]